MVRSMDACSEYNIQHIFGRGRDGRSTPRQRALPSAAPRSMLSLLFSVLSQAPLRSQNVPLFKQCDEHWGKDMMGVEGKGHRATICAEGCAMSCVAMALKGSGFRLPGTGAEIDPGTLNAYLIASRGYRCDKGDCDNLVLSAPDSLTGGRMRFVGEWAAAELPMKALSGLSSGERMYLGHVHNPRSGHVNHFVLLRSYDNTTDTFAVLDPGFEKATYARVNVSDLLMYEMLPSTSTVPLAYPLFKQCDPAWAKDAIHVKTVCAVGCLMSSTSMALRERGVAIPVDGQPHDATPGTLNAWLKAHGGYVLGTDDLEEAAVQALDPKRISWTNASMHVTNDLSWSDVVNLLNAGAAVIANVMGGHHFVLVVGCDAEASGDVLYVNDPGFSRASYSFSKDVVGWRLYAIARQEQDATDVDGRLSMVAQLDAIQATGKVR